MFVCIMCVCSCVYLFLMFEYNVRLFVRISNIYYRYSTKKINDFIRLVFLTSPLHMHTHLLPQCIHSSPTSHNKNTRNTHNNTKHKRITHTQTSRTNTHTFTTIISHFQSLKHTQTHIPYYTSFIQWLPKEMFSDVLEVYEPAPMDRKRKRIVPLPE